MGLLSGDRRGRTRTRSGSGSGPVEFALDLKPEAVTLCERKPHGSWRKFAAAQLDDPEFSRVIGLLRDDAETYAGARLPVLLWLPAEQVLKKTVRLRAGPSPEERLQAAFDHVEAKLVYRPEDVAIAVSPADASGETTILITFAATWREARAYAERWGFLPGEVSTRHETEAFGAAGPVFLLRPGDTAEDAAEDAQKRPRRGLLAGLALAGAAAALALVVLRPWETAPTPPEPAPPAQAAAESAEAAPPPQEPAARPPAAPALPEEDASTPAPGPEADPEAGAAAGKAPAQAEPPAAPAEADPIVPEPYPLAARAGMAAPAPQPPPDPTGDSTGAEPAGGQLARATGPAEPVDPRAMQQAPQPALRTPEPLPKIAPPPAPAPAADDPESTAVQAAEAEEPAAADPDMPELDDVEPEAVDDPSWPVPVPRPEQPAAADEDAATPAAVPRAPLPKARPALLPRIRAAAPSRIGSGAKLESAALVGIMNLKTGRKALLRLPDGSFRSVAVGDVLEGWKVTMIGPDAMRVTRQGRDRTLLLVRP